MVLVNGNKYACETCIKGHRSSNCRHTERPLFEIKKKGRPVTQCEHCRELRKTKQVHVKCICEAREDQAPAPQTGTKKGHTKIPDCATFPNGLPAHAVPEPSSESDHCQCKSSAACHCCVPRKLAPRVRRKDAVPVPDPGVPVPSPAPSMRTPSHILARLAELRPVLPRPSHRTAGNCRAAPAHDPSSDRHPAPRRAHDFVYFSPYGRAYDDHQHQHLLQQHLPVPSDFPTDEQIFRDQLRALEAATANANAPWLPCAPLNDSAQPGTGAGALIPSFPSTCGCGDGCRCPGCVEHNPDIAPASTAFSSCVNPSTCTTCLDCTILSLPASLPADTALSIYDLQTSLDDWIRDVSALPPCASPAPHVNVNVNAETQSETHQWEYHPQQQQQQVHPAAATNAFGYAIKPCCGVLCKCDPETCECNIDDERGYDCRREMLFPTFQGQGQGQGQAEGQGEGEGEVEVEVERKPECEDERPGRDGRCNGVNGHGNANANGNERGFKMQMPVRGRLGYFTAAQAQAQAQAQGGVGAGGEYEHGSKYLDAYQDPPRSRSSSTSTSSSHSHSGSSRGVPPALSSLFAGAGAASANANCNANGNGNCNGSANGHVNVNMGGLRLHAGAEGPLSLPPLPRPGPARSHTGSLSPSPRSFEFEFE